MSALSPLRPRSVRTLAFAPAALLLAACAPPPAATVPPPPADRAHLHADDIARPGAHGAPAEDADGTRQVWAFRDGERPSTELRVAERQPDGALGPHRVLIGPHGAPDRPALSPDGQHVAFVWGITGLASVWLIPFDAEATDPGKRNPIPDSARQLTNVGLAPGRGRPDGFVPPPLDTLRFDGDTLHWRSDEGEHLVRWR